MQVLFQCFHVILTFVFHPQLKLCATLVVAGALEVQNGVENLIKQGAGPGLKPYPNFAQYLPANYFKAFKEAFPF